jgi:hypothetical protein
VGTGGSVFVSRGGSLLISVEDQAILPIVTGENRISIIVKKHPNGGMKKRKLMSCG